ncbi:hypothetical protein JN403_03580 [Pseudomonas sp. 15A4]|uniref:hypothetical protein n=1 Tax=Pseudomonas sp. 15A4 TaxID=2804761 RepID=UPI0019672328|nr:hypothetical protein [Pseudomonas sp. 15A4]QSB20122.1 hypothetical protein JN403_03580 [Pseudomonas sp. 15A4]
MGSFPIERLQYVTFLVMVLSNGHHVSERSNAEDADNQTNQILAELSRSFALRNQRESNMSYQIKQPAGFSSLPLSHINALELSPELHSMADTLLYKIHKADSLEQLKWTHGRADGFALGLNVAGRLTLWQADYLMACYAAAREKCEIQLKAITDASQCKAAVFSETAALNAAI